MTIEQYVTYASIAVSAGCVAYAYFSKKTVMQAVEIMTSAVKEFTNVKQTVQETVESLREPLEAAVRQLPKTRSKRIKSDVEIVHMPDGTEPDDAA